MQIVTLCLKVYYSFQISSLLLCSAVRIIRLKSVYLFYVLYPALSFFIYSYAFILAVSIQYIKMMQLQSIYIKPNFKR